MSQVLQVVLVQQVLPSLEEQVSQVQLVTLELPDLQVSLDLQVILELQVRLE